MQLNMVGDASMSTVTTSPFDDDSSLDYDSSFPCIIVQQDNNKDENEFVDLKDDMEEQVEQHEGDSDSTDDSSSRSSDHDAMEEEDDDYEERGDDQVAVVGAPQQKQQPQGEEEDGSTTVKKTIQNPQHIHPSRLPLTPCSSFAAAANAACSSTSTTTSRRPRNLIVVPYASRAPSPSNSFSSSPSDNNNNSTFVNNMIIKQQQQQQRRKKKRVRFDTIEIREYPINIGSSSIPRTGGVPLGISWTYEVQVRLPLDKYENCKRNTTMRRGNQLAISCQDRFDM